MTTGLKTLSMAERGRSRETASETMRGSTQREGKPAYCSRPNRGRRTSTWLVTYADLMTILVCFFVLIVSFSIQDQVKLEVVAGSMRDAFGVTEERRYAGSAELEGAPDHLQPANIRPSESPTANAIAETLTAAPAQGSTGHKGAFDQRQKENALFEQTRASFENAILTHPLLKDQSDAITISIRPEGLQIVMVDTDQAPMFDLGSSRPTPHAELLLQELTQVLRPLPNRVVIEGHADASGQGRYSPFDLTMQRANAARRILETSGLSQDRIAGVVGRGTAYPLYEDDPYAAGNRRVEILLERAAPLLPPGRSL